MTQFAVRADPNNVVIYREVGEVVPRSQQVFRRGWFAFMDHLSKKAEYEVKHGTKHGRIYYIRGTWASRRLRPGRVRTKRHQASAPGETHANLTGRAIRSLSWKVHGWYRADFGYGISTGKSSRAPYYVKYLEYGTPRGQMEPRPTLANAIAGERAEPFFDLEFDREFK